MQRARLFIGPPGSGKTKKVKEILADMDKQDYVFISARGKDLTRPFAFSMCEKTTRLVVLDDVHLNRASSFGVFWHFITAGIKVNKQCQSAFIIYPEFLFTSTDFPKDMGQPSFDHRFSVIEFPDMVELNPLKNE